ncbi:CPBP family intramembrane glutamic endopeptidase [Blattabacterium cuenoti]|uniref:CPBP family intramembrane glutamic endopeptidase n=1 Tax=Blattabacterium cuenoti TaxID=1653831 RepID=UPI00293BBA57|nr:type II CAAX endopeptidase family protein [Blattabacterium cuenoti]
MNAIKNYFKINYVESILLVIAFITLNFINVFIRKFLLSLNLSENTIFAVSYSIPFIILFTFISHQAKKKNLVVDLSIRISPWYVYFVIFFMMLSAIILNEHLSSLVPKEGPILENMYKEIEVVLKEEVKNPIPFFSTTVLLAPICEEILFRGIILNGMLRNKIHPIKAIIFSSFLFGLTHMNPWQLLGGLFVGSFIGYIYYITNSITDCILLHILNNFIATVGIFYSLDDGLDYNNLEKLDNNNHVYIFLISILILLSGSYFLLKKRKNILKLIK